MNLFPIGAISSGTNNGTMDGVNYSMFEPNGGCFSRFIYSNLLATFESAVRSTRKKAEDMMSLAYNYEGIFTREYRQLQHFFDLVSGELNSFLAIDWSQGLTPSSVVDGGSVWVASVSNTRLFSSISNQKANYVFFWNTGSWKLTQITTVTANTSLSCSISDNYGAMTFAQAQVLTGSSKTMIYPVYDVYITGGIDSFKEQEYVDLPIGISTDGGYTYTGNLAFMTRYKV